MCLIYANALLQNIMVNKFLMIFDLRFWPLVMTSPRKRSVLDWRRSSRNPIQPPDFPPCAPFTQLYCDVLYVNHVDYNTIAQHSIVPP